MPQYFNEKEPLVVYIIGDNRSGSTLLDYLLSCHPDAISVGELHQLNGFYAKKGVGIVYDWKCSCGADVQDCSFWNKILQDISFQESTRTLLNVRDLDRFSFLSPSLYKKSLRKNIDNPNIDKLGKEVAQNRWKLYKAIQKHTQKRVIIDSSKDVHEAYFLSKYKQGNIKFLFLERDIRAVALSQKTRMDAYSEEVKNYLGTNKFPIYIKIYSAYKRLLKNHLIALMIQDENEKNVVNYVMYSDLAKNTKKVIECVCNFLNIQKFDPPSSTNEQNNERHVLCGSPSRYEKRPIVYDSRWKEYYKSKPLIFYIGKYLRSFIIKKFH